MLLRHTRVILTTALAVIAPSTDAFTMLGPSLRARDIRTWEREVETIPRVWQCASDCDRARVGPTWVTKKSELSRHSRTNSSGPTPYRRGGTASKMFISVSIRAHTDDSSMDMAARARLITPPIDQKGNGPLCRPLLHPPTADNAPESPLSRTPLTMHHVEAFLGVGIAHRWSSLLGRCL
ncbi:hypothetical protein BD309DRAFT_197842 [Dichomitus squalens]|nr:hypothetical protein BD309DRAFT_197842 [Dichomitus squalens]